MKCSIWLWLSLGACVGCGADAPEGGVVEMDFEIATSTRKDAAEQLLAPVYGAIYHAKEVGALGPMEGAESVVEVRVSEVDLRTVEISLEKWESSRLPPGTYQFLGFFDLNDNADPTAPEPDSGDPITLPGVNTFDIEDGAHVAITAFFGMLFP